MIAATTVVGIDVSRDWLDGFCFPGEQRFRLANSVEGHEQLTATIREMPGAIKVGFEATGGQEWVLWAKLVEAEIEAVQLPRRRSRPLPFPGARGRRQTGSMLGRMTAGEAAAMAGLAPVPHDSGTMRGRRAIAGGRRALRHGLYQAALAAACHNSVLKPVAKRLKGHGKQHKFVIVAIARRLVVIANAILKTGVPWQLQPAQ